MDTITNRKKQALETKRKIYDIAVKLFAEYGFDKVSIQQICKECEISVGGFYHHYKTKTDILDEGYRLFDKQTQEYFENNHPSSPIRTIYFLIEKQTDSVTELGYKAFSQYLNNQLYLDGKFILHNDRYFPKKIKECVELAVENELLCGDASTIAEELLSTSRGLIYDWCLHNGTYSIKERALSLTKMILSFYQNK